MGREEDSWYAAAITRIVMPPRQTIETFGTTTIRYYLVSELMDQVGQVRVREGKVYSERPQIIAPTQFRQLLEGFGPKAQEYLEQLQERGLTMNIVRYGLQFRKDQVTEEILSEPADEVADRLAGELRRGADDLTTVILGADEMWEISLLKFMVDYVERSKEQNLRDLQQRDAEEGRQLQDEIEADFRAALQDRHKVAALGNKLQRLGLFEEYEDRFFKVVQRHG